MNKVDLLTLFTRCPRDSPLFSVAQEAAKKLEASSTPRISLGDPQSSDDLLRIYRYRLKRATDRHLQNTGLKETVETFAQCKGPLRGGYAKIQNDLIYFWTDSAGNIAGCVL